MRRNVISLAVLGALLLTLGLGAQVPRTTDSLRRADIQRSFLKSAAFTRTITVAPDGRGDYSTLALAYTYITSQTHDATHHWQVIVYPDATITSPGTRPTFTSVEVLGSVPSGITSTFTFAPAAGAANVSEITITATDAAGATVASVQNYDLWLSDSATCAGLTGTTATGAVAAKAASGVDLVVYTAKKAQRVQTLATGVYVLSITDTAKTGFFVCAAIPSSGKAVSSAQLVAGNFG